MSAQNGSTTTHDYDVEITDAPALDKGKGKAVARQVEEEDSSDEEETADEGIAEPEADEEEEDDDDMAEIDTSNIITTGRRTRGKTIDFAKAAAEAGAPEEDEDDDEDFEAHEDDDDAMQE